MKTILLSVSSAIAIAMSTLPVLAAVPDLKAFSAPNGQVLILPSATKTALQPLNKGAAVTGGGTVTTIHGTTLTLPETLSSGMLINANGAIVSTNAYVTPQGRLIMHRTDRRIIDPRRAVLTPKN